MIFGSMLTEGRT